jgi:hypothetical protein
VLGDAHRRVHVLIAQAVAEGLRFVTNDGMVSGDSVQTMWCNATWSRRSHKLIWFQLARFWSTNSKSFLFMKYTTKAPETHVAAAR